MILYPNLYIENVQKLTIDYLKENEIKALILDVDNTLIDFYKKIPDGTKQWCEDLKKQGIKFCILSNSNNVEKVKKVAEELDVHYIYFAMKPLKKGFKKAIEYLQEKPENIAAVGDQIFTDVIGANRSKVKAILVKPLEEKDILITKIKRPLENFIIKRYLNSLKNN